MSEFAKSDQERLRDLAIQHGIFFESKEAFEKSLNSQLDFPMVSVLEN